MSENKFTPGQTVIDRDDDNPDEAVVVHCPETTIAEVTITDSGDERTVAEDNPAYDPSEPAVIIAFVESGLEQDWPAWRNCSTDLYAGVQNHGVKCYTFPAARLTPVSAADEPDASAEVTIARDALQARLEDAEWSTTLTDEGTLIVEKMDEQYQISSTGQVDGDGQLRGPLENLVEQYRK